MGGKEGGVITNGPSFIEGLGRVPRVTAAKELRTKELSSARSSLVPPYVPSTSKKNKTQPTHREKVKTRTRARRSVQKKRVRKQGRKG